jgi:hypothetical protein
MGFKKIRIYKGRQKLHKWFAYLEKEMPELDIHPCKFGADFCCDCHLAMARIYQGSHPRMRARVPWQNGL